MKRKFGTFGFSTILAVSMLLSGCGGGNAATASAVSSAGASSVSTESAAKDMSKDTLTIAVAGDIPSLNGAQNSRTTDSICWPTLFTLNETADGGYEFDVDDRSCVKTAEWADDNSSIVLTLKDGIKMHDGTTLDTDDVITSINVEMEKKASAANGLKNVDSVEKVDDHTVKVKFKSARVSNWQDLAQARVFSKEAYEADGSDFDHFCMTPSAFASYGPYKFSEFSAGDHLTFTKFDDYFVANDSPIKNVIFRRIDESTVAMMELQTGGVDVIMYPAESDITDVKNNTYENIKYTSALGQYQQLIVFNLSSDSLCKDVNVRKALCYAIDRQSMWEGAFEKSGEFANTPVTKAQEFVKEYEEPYPQDLEKAKQMLKDAGIAEGTTFRVCVDNDTYRTTAVEMFKNTMKSIGYEVEISTGDNAAYLQSVLHTTTWDLEFGKSGMIGSVAYWNEVQWPLFNHGDTAAEDFSEFLDLQNQVLAEFDDSKREELTQKYLDEYVNKYCISYPIRQDIYGNLENSKLEGFTRWGEQWNLVGAYFSE